MFAKKSLGQNFLVAPQTITKVVHEAHLSSNDTVIEIGPGHGALTKEILNSGARVIAIEKDRDLYQELTETFQDYIKEDTLTLIEGDVLEIDFETLGVSEYKVVANIPYYITGILIRKLLTQKNQPHHVVLIVQKEIAERIAREKKESLLSLSVKAYGTPRYAGTIRRGAFTPQPKVDSAILVIEDISRNFFSEIDEVFFFRLLKSGFSQKRKQVLNNLESIKGREGMEKAFIDVGINTKARAEDISLNEWRLLARLLQTA